MFVPLGIKTDYSLLQSLIKVKDLITFLKKHNITTCSILDNNLYGANDFYFACLENGIKPIIGLDVIINNCHVYLYAKNYNGYQKLLKLNTILCERSLSIQEIKLFANNIIIVTPLESLDIYKEFSSVCEIYISYKTETERSNALTITSNVVYINEVRAFTKEDTAYIKSLDVISESETSDYSKSYFKKPFDDDAIKSTLLFSELINVEIPTDINYLPKYDEKIDDSYSYLASLAQKGLNKRLNGNVSDIYLNRLKHELNVIKTMGFVDYFLIVYDYVKFAKKNDILVGPGRGSAAGSLVSYVLGITNVDPIKYDLLFERFLNPDRISMPDIDIDFEFTKREQVIDYVRSRYGEEKVAMIMTFGTLSSKQVVRDVGKCLNINPSIIDRISNMLDSRLNLRDNLNNPKLLSFLSSDSEIKELFKISLKLEGLKRHISTHAAGVVISSETLDKIIPIYKVNGAVLTGVTMEYLERLGLLKMDFLALKNLTIIQNVLNLIKTNVGDININDLPLDDETTLKLFERGETTGVFQYESLGMKNFLLKLKPRSFSDLVAGVALYRPGPMDNIDSFIKRKEGKEKIDYIHDSLKPILEDTYGIIVYQEQIMQILVKMAGYTYARADNIRRAMSKKKKEVITSEQEHFISSAIKQGYTEEVASKVYDLILKFANYGFNKAHSVSYALIGYQMAYLKSNYPEYFIANLLNMSIGSVIKTKEYLDEARQKDIVLLKPSINESTVEYCVKKNALLMPLNIIKNVGDNSAEEIVLERENNGIFKDFFDFVARTYGKSVNKKTIESLIDADVFNEFDLNHKTLHENLKNAITYAELRNDLDESLIMKPAIEVYDEYEDKELVKKEQDVFGFYVTNHPCAKYQAANIMKLGRTKEFFDAFVKTVVIINSVKVIKTKKNEEMAFITAEDETGVQEFVIFPSRISLLRNFKQEDLVLVTGQVTRRYDAYQIVISNIEKI